MGKENGTEQTKTQKGILKSKEYNMSIIYLIKSMFKNMY